MNLIEWKDICCSTVDLPLPPGDVDQVPRNAPDPELVLTVPDPLNVLGNTTFVQRGSRQC